MKILIAEDEESLAKLYNDALQGRDRQVDITHDGEECVEKFTHFHPYDAVVLDVKMPTKNVLDTAKEILELNPNQRIIFVSGYVQETLANSMNQLKQIVAVIQKPFEISKLAEVLEDLDSYSKVRNLNKKVRELDEFDPLDPEVTRLLNELIKIQKPDVWYAIGHIILC